ncbi:hypothetical protein ABLE92_01650 [Gordonia sp. VNQ95]|uniref:hypothetical protein n=1 Tax=Gordonia sp. VNQ95 TaxID=3156619 RepID=UPI0032B43257
MTGWYLIRALGFVSLLAFTGSITLGLASTVGARTPAGADARLIRQLTHRSLAVLGLIALAGHMVLTVLDSYVDVPLTATILPFGSGYRPLAIAVGVIALYAFVVTAVSGWSRGRFAQSPAAARVWRVIHSCAYLGWAASIYHGFTAGTDTHTWWAMATYAVCTAAVGIALVIRGIAARDTRYTSNRLVIPSADYADQSHQPQEVGR